MCVRFDWFPWHYYLDGSAPAGALNVLGFDPGVGELVGPVPLPLEQVLGPAGGDVVPLVYGLGDHRDEFLAGAVGVHGVDL